MCNVVNMFAQNKLAENELMQFFIHSIDTIN